MKFKLRIIPKHQYDRNTFAIIQQLTTTMRIVGTYYDSLVCWEDMVPETLYYIDAAGYGMTIITWAGHHIHELTISLDGSYDMDALRETFLELRAANVSFATIFSMVVL